MLLRLFGVARAGPALQRLPHRAAFPPRQDELPVTVVKRSEERHAHPSPTASRMRATVRAFSAHSPRQTPASALEVLAEQTPLPVIAMPRAQRVVAQHQELREAPHRRWSNLNLTFFENGPSPQARASRDR